MKIKIGNKVKVIANTSGHNYVIGDIYIAYSFNNNMWVLSDLKSPKTPWGNNCYTSDIELSMTSKEDILQSSQELEIRLSEIKDKIKFMSTHKFEDFDQKIFKSYRALEFMKDDKKSDQEKIEFFKSLI